MTDLAPVDPAQLDSWVRDTLELAAEAGARGDPPFGALLIDPGGVVAVGAANRQVSGGDPTAHAEIELLRHAARVGHMPPLHGYTIVINAEPCSMCASAIVKAEIAAVVFGAPHEPHMDPDLGVADVFAHARRPPHLIAGVLAAEIGRPHRPLPRRRAAHGLNVCPGDVGRWSERPLLMRAGAAWQVSGR